MTAGGDEVGAFRLLTVRVEGDVAVAVIPCRRLMGHEYRDRLEDDFRRLSCLGVAAVRLDAGAVEFIDGEFPGLLIGLAKGMAAGGGRLTVEASAGLAEIFRVTNLDRLFAVVAAGRVMGPAEPGDPPDAAAP